MIEYQDELAKQVVEQESEGERVVHKEATTGAKAESSRVPLLTVRASVLEGNL